MTEPSRKTIATNMLPAMSTAALVYYLVAIQDRLPAEVATHWGADGAADGFSPKGTIPIVFGAMTFLVGGLLSLISNGVDRSIVGLRFLRGMPLATVWFLSTLGVVLTVIQLDQTEPPSLPGWAIPSALVAGVAGWGLAVVVAGPTEPAPSMHQPLPGPASAVAGHATAWRGRTPVAVVMLVMAGVLVVVSLAIGWFAGWLVLVIFVPVVALLAASSVYEVTVGVDGVSVAGAVLGFPRVRVPLNQITAATAGSVDAWSFGGWGIRMGANGESAVITRSGPALAVTRTDGAMLRVSLDRPEEPAELLTSLIDLRTGT